MYRKTHYIAVGLVVLLVLILFNLPDKTAAQFKLALGSLFLPLFGLSTSAERLAEKAGNAVMPRADLVRELAQLRQQNQQLRIQAAQAQDLWRENAQLRQAVGWQRQAAWRLKLARVMGRDPANWWRTVTIDLGERDGLRPNQPVLTAEGLVGRTAEVAYTRARVILLGDPKCRVSALVPEAHDSGVISPAESGTPNSPFVELGFLTRSGELRPGQLVYTSGLGGLFPKGILIGQLADWRSVDGLYLEARVKLAANLNALEEVWVMWP